MKALLGFNLHIIVSKKVLGVLLINLLLMTLLFVVFSNPFTSKTILLLQKEQYMLDYVYESMSFIKINFIIVGIYLMMNTTSIFDMEHILLMRRSKIKVLVSVIVSIMMIYTILFFTTGFVFVIVGSFLTPYMDGFNYVSFLWYLYLFGLYYIMLSFGVYRLCKNIYLSMCVLLIYLVGSIFTPYLESSNDVGMINQLFGLVTNDVFMDQEHVVIMTNGWLFVVCLILALILVTIRDYNKSDII